MDGSKEALILRTTSGQEGEFTEMPRPRGVS